MPFYEYRCQDCRSTFGEERSMNETATPVCTDCQSTNVNRIWNAQIRSGAKSAATGRSTANQPSKPSGGCCAGSSHSCGS
ncbi:MAG: zinc ribbon domain-containing protein [Candidatus Obscuribacterales bacterium]|nr:zinc ribbon domain-containing protein [Candidatus Obscuribacterales bacterium]